MQDHGADRRFKNIRLEAAMKITNLEVLLTGTAWRNFLFVKLSTDEGLVGWGDGTLEWKETAVRDLIPDFGRRYVVGANPFGIEGRELSREQLKHACRIVETVRKTVGDRVDLPLEFHGRFNPIMALEAMRAIRKGAHLIQPDIVYGGAFLETKGIAALAATFYISVAPHNCRGPLGIVIAIHLCANIPNFDLFETIEDYDVPWRCDLTPGTPRVRNGYYDLPTGAGWGVEVDEDLIRAHPEKPDAKLNMFTSGWEEVMCK